MSAAGHDDLQLAAARTERHVAPLPPGRLAGGKGVAQDRRDLRQALTRVAQVTEDGGGDVGQHAVQAALVRGKVQREQKFVTRHKSRVYH